MTINEMIQNYLKAKEEEARAKKEKETLKAQILDFCKSENFSTDIFTVIVKVTSSVRLDTKALYKDFPDLKNVYGKESTSKELVITEAEKIRQVK